jgi:hypothetical protein
MRGSFITTGFDHGVSLDDAQRAAGHADLSATKLSDCGGYNQEKPESFYFYWELLVAE